MGVPDKFLHGGGAGLFLKRNATLYPNGNKSWFKEMPKEKVQGLYKELRAGMENIKPVQATLFETPQPTWQITEAEAIAFLKSRNYKISKLVEV